VTRPHPFDLAFGEIAESRFAEIVAEAQEQHRDLRDIAQFAPCATVQHLLQEIEAPDIVRQAPAVAVEYLHTLYAAFRYWNAGKVTLAVAPAHLTSVIAGQAGAVALPVIPRGAVYCQLPERLLWAQVNTQAPHEPIDGFFVAEGARRAWTVVAILGLRPERFGFSHVALTAAGEEVLAAPSLARTPPFAPVLPGGEAAGLYSVCTAAELLHLALLAVSRTSK